MKAVILAAGEGMRCRPLTYTRSKVMLPIANKPTMEYVVQALHDNGITDIVIVVGYAKERAMSYFGNGHDFGVHIDYVEQDQQLGTAHAIKLVEGLVADEFLVLNGDNLVSEKTVADMLKNYSEGSGGTSILTVHKQNTAGYAVVVGSGGRVEKIVEDRKVKNIHNVNTGLYIFDQKIFDAIDETLQSDVGEFGITHSIQQMIDAGNEVCSYRTDSTWMDVVHSWNMLDVNSRILDDVYESIDGRIEGTIGDRADKIVVSDGSVVRAGSHITGPVVIGRDCEIGPNVVIAPSTSIGDNVTIEPFTYIRNSVILDDVYIGSHSTIRNSIIGENNRIDSHFITASGRNLLIELGGILHHADELGSVIGDGNMIGCDVSTDPGTLIGTECRIGTGAVIRGKIPNRAVVI